MKRTVITITLLLSIGLSSIWAENLGTNSSVRYVKAPRFARPLVEKWITEYAKTAPGVEFQLVKGAASQTDIDLNVVSGAQPHDINDMSQIVYFGETAVLPITARSSEAARLLEGKHLTTKKLRQLFFLDDEFDEDGEEVKKAKLFEHLIIYSGSNATSVASAFAHHFGEESSNFRGKRIAGDDLFLNTAISKDPLGVSFNVLPNIFDLKSRHVKAELSLIGLDVKKEQADTFSDSGTLDDVLATLEKDKPQEIAIERVGVSYNASDPAVSQFLEWILEQGTHYNHEYGLLNIK